MKSIGLVFAFVPAAASAQPAASAEPETIVVVDHPPGEASRDRDRALGEAPFVTIVHPDEHPGTASVADAIGSTVGVQTRSLGGLGAYQSITVRGAAPGNTEVMIDGVPLARIAAVTTDLGRFTLDGFGAVELYRGAVPVELGGAGVGGALNLVTLLGPGANGETVRASIGTGSFGARHVRLHYGDSHLGGELLSSTTIGYQGATGDYTYFSDNGTLLNPNDDSFVTRKNNGFDQLDITSRIGLADHSAAGGVRVAWKSQGLPGTALDPAFAASLGTLDVVADARDDIHVGPAIAREQGFVLIEGQHLRDPMGELGLGDQSRDYLTLSGGASSTWLAQFGRNHASAGVELRADRFRDADSTGATQALVGNREGGAALASLDLVVDPDAVIVLTPAIRFDAVRTAPTALTSGPNAFVPVAPRDDMVPSPRLTARAAITSDVSVKASAGWYVRLPTLIELFGDRGTILGTPDLRPERGPSEDAGVVWAPAHAIGELDRVFVETAAFSTLAHDTIAIVPTAGYAARAMNIADSASYGGELVASVRIARTLSLTANYTHLVTAQLTPDIDFANKPLPRQPAEVVYARADVVRHVLGHLASLWFDANWQSDSFLDQASLQRVPARLLLGTGARVAIAARVSVALAIENLADVRIEQLPLVPPPRPDLTEAPTALADLAGFPLPGRSLYLSLDWSH